MDNYLAIDNGANSNDSHVLKGRRHRVLKVSVYFACVQLAIGGRGHVIQHMIGSIVHKTKKDNRESETNTELSKPR